MIALLSLTLAVCLGGQFAAGVARDPRGPGLLGGLGGRLGSGVAEFTLPPHLRASADSAQVAASTAVADSKDCQICLWSVRIIEDVAGDPELSAIAAYKLADKVCALVDKDNQANCAAVLPMYLQLAASYLLAYYHETVPPIACSPICSAVHVAPTAALSLSAKARVRGPMECAFCDYAVEALQRALADETEQEKILAYARAACSDLPASFADVCTQYVDEEGPVLITFLATADPSVVCAMAGACVTAQPLLAPPPPELADVLVKASQLLLPAVASRGMLATPAKLQDEEACEFCKIAVLSVRQKLQEPAFQQAMVAYAKQACERFAPGIADQCSEMLDQYAPLIFSVLVNELDPSKVCAELHFCPEPPALYSAGGL